MTLTQPAASRRWSGFAELHALQRERIGTALRQAANAPFYRDRFRLRQGGTMPGSLADVPVTTKEDLRAAYPFGMLAVPRERVATYHESSGSSGRATSSFCTEDDWADIGERFNRMPAGIGAADTLLVRIPYAMVLAGHIGHHGARMRGATVVPADSRSFATPYARVVRLLHDLGVTLTWSNPTEPLIWAAAARAAGLDPRTDFPRLRALLVCGEPLSDARRERLGELWGASVIEDYGATEVGPLASACRFGRRHFYADRVIPEVLDPATGEFAPDGTGDLVITPLYREAMPLLRYNLEDHVHLSHEPCPCGSWLPVIRLAGRATQAFAVAGRRVSQLQLEELVFRLPAAYGVLFWRARAEAQRLVAEVEVADAHAADACAGLSRAVRDHLDVDCEVTPVPPGTLMPGEVLSAPGDVLKPRSLFGPDEDWSRGLLYY
ncbi:CoF synthetase [Streptomyces sp. CB02923]|uniref:phenylacetate--CoA ligase family protein n=1 Tax=Streptomyces sp. CB02923 TaxID=1718985 RepID=UPI00093C04A8|nr:AMP-binding protein [Streptomyces sp. CB02923]OKI02144.1 CoF synthetase [Streptomyces sp. CB02923]